LDFEVAFGHLEVQLPQILSQLPFQKLFLQLQFFVIDQHLLQFESKQFSLLLFNIQLFLRFIFFAADFAEFSGVSRADLSQFPLQLLDNFRLVIDSVNVLLAELGVADGECLVLPLHLVHLRLEPCVNLLEALQLRIKLLLGAGDAVLEELFIPTFIARLLLLQLLLILLGLLLMDNYFAFQLYSRLLFLSHNNVDSVV